MCDKVVAFAPSPIRLSYTFFAAQIKECAENNKLNYNFGIPRKQSQAAVEPEQLHEIPLAQHRHTLAFPYLKQKHIIKISKLKRKSIVSWDQEYRKIQAVISKKFSSPRQETNKEIKRECMCV